MKFLEARHPKTACPSEVARAIDPKGWREYMQPVRDAAGRLAKRGRIDVLQRGKKVDPQSAHGPIRLMLAAAVDVYRHTNFRKHPDRYRIGRGEQGVLTAEPYKSELLPLWRFKTPAIARASAKALYAAFEAYRDDGDFVGMDMARKFLQMGITRARRYANHASGRKYDARGRELPKIVDAEKAKSAEAFRPYYARVQRDAEYLRLRNLRRKLIP